MGGVSESEATLLTLIAAGHAKDGAAKAGLAPRTSRRPAPEPKPRPDTAPRWGRRGSTADCQTWKPRPRSSSHSDFKKSKGREASRHAIRARRAAKARPQASRRAPPRRAQPRRAPPRPTGSRTLLGRHQPQVLGRRGVDRRRSGQRLAVDGSVVAGGCSARLVRRPHGPSSAQVLGRLGVDARRGGQRHAVDGSAVRSGVRRSTPGQSHARRGPLPVRAAGPCARRATPTPDASWAPRSCPCSAPPTARSRLCSPRRARTDPP